MFRIRTTIGEGRVFTLFFMGKWVTLFNDGKRTDSTDADNVLDASRNHLAFSHKLREIVNERAKHSRELLHGQGCSGSNGRGTSSDNGESHRTGTHGDDRDERDQNLSSNPSASEDQDACEFGSQDAELKDG